jgi:sporulation protein YlmC with PRC-barrel domain
MRDAIDANLELLDRQIVDHDGAMVAKVDDLELEEREDGRLHVTALLTGPGALGPRLGGAFGNMVTSTWSRLAGRTEPGRVPWSSVASVGIVVTLAVDRTTVAVDGLEVWMRDRVVAAIPGSKVLPK